MVGQPAYVPFENDRLPWVKTESESAATTLVRTGGSTPSVLVFIGSGDSESCCAKNYERTIFRDANVVALVKQGFLAMRIERTSDAARPYNLKKNGIVVLDGEGDEVGRFIDCTDVPSVLTVLREALARQKQIQSKGAEWSPRIAKAEKLEKDGKSREVAQIVQKAQREKRLSKALRARAEAVAKALGDRGAALVEDAKARDLQGEPGPAVKILRSVRDDYEGLPVATTAKTELAALERDGEKRTKAREFLAREGLETARALAAEGKKPEAQNECRKVIEAYEGTQACAEAKTFLSELSNPALKAQRERLGGR